MSLAATLEMIARGRPFTMTPDPHDTLGQAGQRLWRFIWRATSFGRERCRKTDREMAEACGRSRRWVQKALRQLLDFLDESGEADPYIEKSREYGPRESAGRIITVAPNMKFAEPRAESEPKAPATAPAGPAPAPRAKGGPKAPTYGTNSPPPGPKLPEGHADALAAERAARAAAEAEEYARAHPKEAAEVQASFDRAAARSDAAAADPSAQAQGGPQPARQEARPRRLTPEELRAQLDVVRRMAAGERAARGPSPEAPSGPEAPEPKPRE